MNPAIEFENVSKKFVLRHDRPRSFQELLVGLPRKKRQKRREKFWALRDVSFRVMPGEALGLIGPNGAGKSTALKLLSRIMEPDSGRITVRGQVGALLELGAGFHPDLTGRENIYLNGSILGLGRTDIRRKMDEIIAFAELERFIDMPVKHYSSGMHVRLGFSVAVHTEPDVLLVDEVLAVGDQNFQHKCLDRIRHMQRQGVTICLVTHDLGAVRRLCSHAIWLEDGEIQATGPVEDSISAYLHHAAEEEERQADQQSPGEVEADDRWGTGAIEIEAVSFLDGKGEERHVFNVGEPWQVQLRYRASRRVEAPVFGLAIHRDDGVHICGPNTQFAGVDIPWVEEEGRVGYQVDALTLMEGTYHVSVSAHNRTGSVMYDYHDRRYTFKVRQVDQGERYGLVSLGGTWRWDGSARHG